jgi:hypothetical protein
MMCHEIFLGLRARIIVPKQKRMALGESLTYLSGLVASGLSGWLRLPSWLRPISLLESFESFGDNCEFGFVQNAHDARTIGLFRFASTSIDSLIDILTTRFSALTPPDRVELTIELRSPAHRRFSEYVVVLHAYGIEYHAGALKEEATFEEIEVNQRKRVALLSRKMIEDLEEGAKIFVFKSRSIAPRSKIDELVSRMRDYGPATLLWVTPCEDGHPPGRVEEIYDGLLRGYVDRFAPYDDAGAFSPLFWDEICRNAYRLWSRRRARRAA